MEFNERLFALRVLTNQRLILRALSALQHTPGVAFSRDLSTALRDADVETRDVQNEIMNEPSKNVG